MVNLINPPKAKKPTKKALLQEIFSKTDLTNASIERANVEAIDIHNRMIDVLIKHNLMGEV